MQFRSFADKEKKMDLRVLATWMSTGTKLAGFAIVLPIAVVKLTPNDLNIWLMGLVAINLINLVEFSVNPTTIRQFSYERGLKTSKNSTELINGAFTLHFLAATFMTVVTIAYLFYFTQNSGQAATLSAFIWLLPALVLFKIINAYYVAILHSYDKIPLQRTIETLGNLTSSVLTLVALTTYADVSLLICLQILPQTLSFPFIRKIARKIRSGERVSIKAVRSQRSDLIDPTVNQLVASTMGFGALQIIAIYINAATPLIFANSFLLSLRIIQSIATFTNPLFYSYIPVLARNFKEAGYTHFQNEAVQKGKKALKAFAGFISIASIAIYFAEYLPNDYGQKAPQFETWIVLAFAFMAHRIGAINLQISAIAGVIRFQLAETVSTIFLILEVALLNYTQQPKGITFAILATYLVIFLPISLNARKRAKEVNL